MSKFQVFDRPIGHPDNDLFGMSAYAEKLAGFIKNVEPPFTIGIYGEWGDGKTSFVRLLEHFLANPALDQMDESAALLEPGDFDDAAGLADKLKGGKDPLSTYLREMLQQDTRALLEKYDAGTPPEPLQTALLGDLNRLLRGELLHNGQRFAHVTLTKDLQERIEKQPGGAELVRLNRDLLRQAYPLEVASGRLKFITFSAWPHTTSDAVWRALILKIARDLYGINDSAAAAPEATPPPPTGLGSRLAAALRRDALVLRRPAPVPEPDAEYKALLARLDRSAYGTISKNKEEQLQVNEEAALMAIVKAGVTALGSLSPLVAAVRGLVGWDASIDLSEALHREKNAAAREVIESVQEFKRAFTELFARRASGKRVFVFIDDLDRCLPDVALDLLEAIKIFFEEVRCIFVVAADENLIGQGLRLRFKELLGTGRQQEVESLFAQKGKEYFEKIIQFPIRVPPRNSTQAHNFISAQFPKWTPATDIIQTAIGGNPRRLIQYCNLLSYKYAVHQMQLAAEVGGKALTAGTSTNGEGSHDVSREQFEFLDKLMALQSWLPGCLTTFRQLLARPDGYASAMGELEQWLQNSREDSPDPAAADPLGKAGCHELYLRAVALSPVFKLMQASPRFSCAEMDPLSTFVGIADIIPTAGEPTLESRDAVFMRILTAIEKDSPVAVGKLMIEDLTKIITFDKLHPELFNLLCGLAGTDGWTEQLKGIEESLEPPPPESGTPGAPLGSQAGEALKLLQSPDDSALLKRFLAAPSFSSIPRETLLRYGEMRVTLPESESVLDKAFDASSAPERYSRAAVKAVDQLPQAARQAIEGALRLRIQAARYLVDLRRFAKLDALAFTWPDLAKQLQFEGTAVLRELEKRVNDPASMGGALGGLWAEFLRDQQIVRFLSLRPFFRDISERELKRYFAVAQVVVKASEIQKPATATDGEPKSAPAPALVAEEFTPADYENLLIRLVRSEGDEEVFNLTVVDNNRVSATVQIKLPLGEIQSLHESLRDLSLYQGPGRETSELTPRNADPMARLPELGTLVYEMIFKQGVKSDDAESLPEVVFRKALTPGRRLRIVIDGKGSRPMLLPWEVLYVPQLRIFPSLVVPLYSVVRRLPEAKNLVPRTLTQPLRILFASANPEDAPYLDTELEMTMLQENLAEAVHSGQVKLKFIQHVTLEQLTDVLRDFKPHLFHFVGHGVFQRTSMPDGQLDEQGALVFENHNHMTHLVSAFTLKAILTNSNVSLVILNSCETGTSGIVDAIAGVAGALVDEGISAVIATTRAVVDQAAIRFSRQFYKSFVAGGTLEASITEARDALSIERWDWSAYALFVGTTELDNFKLVQRQRGQEEGQIRG